MAEKTLTKEEWAQVEKTLSGIYGRVELLVDDLKVLLSREQVSKNTLGIVVFIEGRVNGAWFGATNDCPEQPYTYPKHRYVYTAKSRAEQKKIIQKFGKKQSAGIGITIDKIDKKITLWQPMFPSAKAVRRHYEKTFNSIELLEADSI